jgi:hypothetical protein
VDSSIIDVPVQQNCGIENSRIKAGDVQVDLSEATLGRKMSIHGGLPVPAWQDFGYLTLSALILKHTFIRDFAVAGTAVHDNRVFGKLPDGADESKDVGADFANSTEDTLTALKQRGYREHLLRKRYRNRQWTDREKQSYRTRARIRCRIEHVFGIRSRAAGNRTIGKARAYVKIDMRIPAHIY